MRICVFSFLLVMGVYLFPAPVLAIINAEDLDLSIDGDGIAGNVSLSVNGSSGNSEKINGEATGHMLWRYGLHMDMLVGSFNYGKSRGVRDTNKSFLHLRHRYAWNGMWSLEAFAQAQQDEFARLKLRTLMGGGMCWSMHMNALEWHVGLGSFYEREQLRAVGVTVEPIARLWRVNTFLALRYAWNERLRIQNTVYYQPAWKDIADYRILNDAALHVALNDTLDLKLSFELAKDARPPVGVRGTDMSYKTGLSFHF